MKIDFNRINKIFATAAKENRFFLFEHEVYHILNEAGIKTPKFIFVEKNQKINEKDLSIFRKKGLIGSFLFLYQLISSEQTPVRLF